MAATAKAAAGEVRRGIAGREGERPDGRRERGHARTLTAPSRRVAGHPGRGVPDLTPPPLAADTPWNPRKQHPTRVFVLAPTRASARNTEGAALSRITRAEVDEMLAQIRKPSKAQVSAAYWTGQVADAENGTAALNKAWSQMLGALTALRERDPGAADDACWHLTRGMTLASVQMPDSKFESRPGLTEAEARKLLFDPWGKQGAAS